MLSPLCTRGAFLCLGKHNLPSAGAQYGRPATGLSRHGTLPGAGAQYGSSVTLAAVKALALLWHYWLYLLPFQGLFQGLGDALHQGHHAPGLFHRIVLGKGHEKHIPAA